eukprot:494112-Amphidinium_carterae.1
MQLVKACWLEGGTSIDIVPKHEEVRILAMDVANDLDGCLPLQAVSNKSEKMDPLNRRFWNANVVAVDFVTSLSSCLQ